LSLSISFSCQQIQYPAPIEHNLHQQRPQTDISLHHNNIEIADI